MSFAQAKVLPSAMRRVIGIVLAGGFATRMGGRDKAFARVGGRPVVERVVATLRTQCDAVLISANGDPSRFGACGCAVVADEGDQRVGPLGGVLAGLDAVARLHPEAGFVVTAPTDAPFVPDDLVARLQDARIADRAAIACARSGGRVHPTSALWSIDLRHDLRTAIADGVRRMQLFFARHPIVYATWPTEPVDPFFNVNTPGDLAAAETMSSASPHRQHLAESPKTRL